VRFPGDLVDENTNSREFHGVGIRPSRRNTIDKQVTHSGSLGASPRFSNMRDIPPVPQDLKDLIRKLLKRDPVQRISFEEFFMTDCVFLYRKIEPKLSSSPLLSSPMFKIKSDQSSPYTTSPTFSMKRRSSLAADITKDLIMDVTPPFPFYGLSFDNDHIRNIVVPQIRQLSISTTFEKTSHRTDKHSSASSEGSSFGSFEFSDEEEKKKRAVSKVESDYQNKNGSEEFIVVENKVCSSPVKHEGEKESPKESKKQMDSSNMQQSQHKSPTNILPNSSLKNMLTKHTRDFRHRNTTPPHHSTSTISYTKRLDVSAFYNHSEISDKLSFLSSLPSVALEDSRINQLIFQAIRAQCVIDFIHPKNNDDLRILLVHTLELFDKCMKNAEKITKALTTTGTPLLKTEIFEFIIPIVSWIKIQFNKCLSSAEQISVSLDCNNNAFDIIYQNAIEFSKKAANFELMKDLRCKIEYQKSILLLEGLIDYPGVKQEQVVVDRLLIALYSRLNSLK
jgi:hypothetical protein